MRLRGLERLVVIQTARIVLEIVGIGQVAVDARHRLPADCRILGRIVEFQALLQVAPGIHGIRLLLVHLGQEAQGLPQTVLIIFLFRVFKHPVQQGEGLRDLPAAEIVVLGQVV